MTAIKATDVVLVLSVISDIYFRFKAQGVEVTPENIRDHIADLEAKAEANDRAMGIAGE